MTGLLNHLWQSSLFAVLAGLLTLALRRNSARTRYWLWFAASVKFFIPFFLLVEAGSRVEWRRAPEIAQPAVSVSMEQVFTAPTMILGAPKTARHEANYWPAVLGALWFCGFATVLISWTRQWWRIRIALRTAKPCNMPLPIKTMLSPTLLEPGVFGVFRPVLLLPEGIAERLMPDQLDAIVAHELCHIRSRDNFAAAVHMLVEAIFWFHPLVWWIGKRLVDERERACDEEVLRLGSAPEVYAESILKVCEFYLESPLDCVSGITGSDLRKRIRGIMTNRVSRRLSAGRKLMLAVVGVVAVMAPIMVGIVNSPIRAQSASSSAAPPAFEVASIKPAPRDATERGITQKPGGRLSTSNATLKQLVYLAYQVMPVQVSGGPDWVGSAGFDIEAKPAVSNPDRKQFRQMIQTLLADRFHLKFHMETKQLPVYELVVGKRGAKLTEDKSEGLEVGMRNLRGELQGDKATMPMLAGSLTRVLQRQVVDQTGLKGAYSFRLRFLPDQVRRDDGEAPDSDGASIFTALEEQLGLSLRATKGPVEVFVIDSAERPSDNDHAFFRQAMYSPQTFEVASVKPAGPGDGGMKSAEGRGSGPSFGLEHRR